MFSWSLPDLLGQTSLASPIPCPAYSIDYFNISQFNSLHASFSHWFNATYTAMTFTSICLEQWFLAREILPPQYIYRDFVGCHN